MMKWLRIRPFRPIRITLSDGGQYEIRHPDLVLVDQWTATIGLASPKGLDEPLEGKVEVALLHVSRIETIDGKKKTASRKP
jgi:hypothetical protein